MRRILRGSGSFHTHVVGAGLSGLAAAIEIAYQGGRVSLYEAAPHAGGRCRSYFDAELARRIDNGNHLLLSGNRAALSYVDRIGARGSFFGPPEAAFPFVDLTTGARWELRPNRSPLPFWVLRENRRVPHTRAHAYLAPLRLLFAGPDASVSAVLGHQPQLFRQLWEPLAVAALNTSAAEGSARLFFRILRETLGRGGAACRPLVPREGLSESLVDPALARLDEFGVDIRFGARLRALEFSHERVCGLLFDEGATALGRSDFVILAVPASVAARFIEDLVVPERHAPIVNAHFLVDAPADSPLFIGVIGGVAQWIFRKKGVLSVTVSAAEEIVDRPAEELRKELWCDVARAYRLPETDVPPARILKERRATFLAAPIELRRRPKSATHWRNLFLSGDYIDTGLPATIEGAIRSGFAAARHVLAASRAASGQTRSGMVAGAAGQFNREGW